MAYLGKRFVTNHMERAAQPRKHFVSERSSRWHEQRQVIADAHSGNAKQKHGAKLTGLSCKIFSNNSHGSGFGQCRSEFFF